MDNAAVRHEKIGEYSRYIGQLRAALLGALVLTFGWLKLHDVALLQAVRSVEAHTIMTWAMVLYFASWAAGSNFDIKLRKENYFIPPAARAFGWLFPLYIALAIGFGVLCWVVSTPAQFAAFLLVFWCINWSSWWAATRKIFPNVLDATKLKASEHHTEPATEALLEALKEYETGTWQWRRFIAGSVLILVINVFNVTHLDSLVVRRLSWPVDLVFAMSILLFVCLMEGWMWYWRLRIHFDVSSIRWLAARFDFVPREQR